MPGLGVIKSPEEDSLRQHSGNMYHGTTVTRRLVDPWINNDRVVCADSYFTSTETVRVLADVGTRFIGVLKTASGVCPMECPSSKQIARQ